MKWWPWPALRVRGCLTVLFIFGCGLLAGGFLGATIGWVGCFNKIVGGFLQRLRNAYLSK